MPNLLERMPLGGEPGCREAAMDPQNIKLFGQTISVASNHTGAGADAEVLKQQSASPLWDTAQTSRQVCPFSALLAMHILFAPCCRTFLTIEWHH